MNDIDLLNLHLDAHPDDQTARLALSDLLRESGSELADGMAALVRWGLRPGQWDNFGARKGQTWWWLNGDDCGGVTDPKPHEKLPADWYEKLDSDYHTIQSTSFDTQTEAANAAALAFTRLPPERQQELLSGPQS